MTKLDLRTLKGISGGASGSNSATAVPPPIGGSNSTSAVAPPSAPTSASTNIAANSAFAVAPPALTGIPSPSSQSS